MTAPRCSFARSRPTIAVRFGGARRGGAALLAVRQRANPNHPARKSARTLSLHTPCSCATETCSRLGTVARHISEMEPTANGNLALIFILSMLLLFLVPWTLCVRPDAPNLTTRRCDPQR